MLETIEYALECAPTIKAFAAIHGSGLRHGVWRHQLSLHDVTVKMTVEMEEKHFHGLQAGIDPDQRFHSLFSLKVVMSYYNRPDLQTSCAICHHGIGYVPNWFSRRRIRKISCLDALILHAHPNADTQLLARRALG